MKICLLIKKEISLETPLQFITACTLSTVVFGTESIDQAGL